jgi:hypothetical protein
MKKYYFLAAAIGLASFASAQQGVVYPAKKSLKTLEVNQYTPQQTSINRLKGPGDPIWSEDFDGDPSWVTGGAQDIWAFDTNGPDGQFSSNNEIIESTTANNGFMIFDADDNQPGASSTFFDHVGWMETPAIDMTGFTELTLQFEHTYRSCCAAGFEPTIEVSDDDFATSVAYSAGIPGIEANDIAPTTLQKINLNDFIANATDLTNVKIRFLFDGSGGTSHYWWQVDDVEVIESYTDDLFMGDYFLASGVEGIPYHRVPVDQLVDVEFSGIIENIGVNDQNGVELDVLIDNGASQSNFTSAPVVINAANSDSLVTTTNWLPTGTAGTGFDLTFTANQTETEQEPSDNQRVDNFLITDSSYSVDNGLIRSDFGNFVSNSGQPIGIGNQMEIMQDTWITSMTVRVANTATSPVGQTIYGQLHVFDAGAGSFIFQNETNFYTLANGDPGGFVTLVFENPIQVSAGDVILPMAFHDGQDVRFGSAQLVPQGVVIGYTPSDQSYGTLIDPNAIMLRVNLNPNVSIDAEELAQIEMSQYPNPFSKETNVEYSLENSSSVSYTVIDVTGQVLLDVNEGVKAAGTHKFTIDGTSFSNGIYYLSMKVDGATVTRKLVVNK